MKRNFKILIIVFAIITLVCLVLALMPIFTGEIAALESEIHYYNEEYVLHYIDKFEWSLGVELAEAEITQIVIRSVIFGVIALGSLVATIMLSVKSKASAVTTKE